MRMNEIFQNLGFIALVTKQSKTKQTLNAKTCLENPEFSFWMVLLALNTPCAFVIFACK